MKLLLSNQTVVGNIFDLCHCNKDEQKYRWKISEMLTNLYIEVGIERFYT